MRSTRSPHLARIEEDEGEKKKVSSPVGYLPLPLATLIPFCTTCSESSSSSSSSFIWVGRTMSAKKTQNTQHIKDERTNERTNGRLDPGREEDMNTVIAMEMDEVDSFANLMYGCIDGLTDGWMDGRLVGWLGWFGWQAGRFV